MALDSSILAGIKTDADVQKEALANRLAGQEVQANQYKLDQYPEDLKRQRKSEDLLMRKQELENAKLKTDQRLQMLGGVDSPEKYEMLKQRVLQEDGTLGDMPAQYDPDYVAFEMRSGLSVKEQLELASKEHDRFLEQAKFGMEQSKFDLDRQKFEEDRRHNLASESNTRLGKLSGSARVADLLQTADKAEAMGDTATADSLRAAAQSEQVEAEPSPKMYTYGNVPDPLKGIQDGKRRDIELGKLGTEAQVAIGKYQDVVAKEQGTKAALRKFEAAMDRQGGSGGLAQNTPFVAGIQKWADPDIADMAQVQAEIAPNMRPEGSGATSDYDAKQFERATVGPEKPTESNRAIIKARIAAADLASDKADFLEAYRADNGHIRGAEAEWRRYLNANPIFDKNKGGFNLNPARKNWQEFFGGKQKAQGAPQAAPAAQGQNLQSLKSKYGLE